MGVVAFQSIAHLVHSLKRRVEGVSFIHIFSHTTDATSDRNSPMNEMMIFENPEFGSIRTVEINGEAWLVGKDVAVALGYKEPTKAVRERVDREDRGVSKIDTPSGTQDMTIINESGLYSLILSSKLPGAKKFRRWVTSEVLPAIRKHGLYAVDQLLDNPEFAIKAFTALKEEREKRIALEQKVEADRPK